MDIRLSRQFIYRKLVLAILFVYHGSVWLSKTVICCFDNQACSIYGMHLRFLPSHQAQPQIERKRKRSRWIPGSNLLQSMYTDAEYEKDIHELYLKQRIELRYPLIGKLKYETSVAPSASSRSKPEQERYKPGQATSSSALPIQQKRLRPTGSKTNKTKSF